MAKTVLFRADSSSKIGTGHIMRDLVLAKKYQQNNYKVIFATRNLIGNINNEIAMAGYQIKLLKSNKQSEITKIIQENNIDEIVIDHYQIDWKYEKEIKLKTNIRIVSFDDIYLKHHCDIIYNHNIYADKKKYKSLVPDNCIIQCGSKYTLLRDEFITAKKSILKNKKTKSIFIAMGGADTTNLNISILRTLENISNLTIHIVTTTSNKNIKNLQQFIINKKSIHLHINSSHIASILSKASIAIITPSVMANEVYYMNIPFIAIKTADNQKEMFKYCKKKKIPILKKFNEKKLLQYTKILLKKVKNDFNH